MPTAQLPRGLMLPYAEVGPADGVPVVFLHGFADSWLTMEPLLQRLPPGLHGYAYTQRGHGSAGATPSGRGLTPADLAEDVVPFLDAVGVVGTAVLVGGSSGGVQARIVAGRHPDRVAGLVLLGTPARLADKPGAEDIRRMVSELADPVPREFVERFNAGFAQDGVLEAELLRRIVDEAAKTPAQVWRETLRGLLAPDLADSLAGVSAPTLVVWGSEDAILDRADQQLILDAVPGAELLTYRGAGHALYWERPDQVARDIGKFVSRLPR